MSRWRQVEQVARNSMRLRRVQPKSDPRRHPRMALVTAKESSVGRSEVTLIEFSSRARECQRLASLWSSSSLPYPRFSFFTRPTSRYSSVRYLRAHARTQPVEKRIAILVAVSRGRILRARITRWGYLPSISSLGEKIVLRACFGVDIDYGETPASNCVIRMLRDRVYRNIE